MKFNELDKKMRLFETSNDYCILPGIFIAARLDGRNFTTLTKKKYNFKTPFDIKFRDIMVNTLLYLMDCGFNIIYGYTESDEISLLFNPVEDSFSRKLRKLNSILAGEASAKFSVLLGSQGVFDCRISQLPREDDVINYFRWRNEDANRNSLNSNCYWILRKEGKSAKESTNILDGLNVAEKNEFLFKYKINYNDLPSWQKRGIGVYWETYKKMGYNPIKNLNVMTERKRLKIEYDLPMKDNYDFFIKDILNKYL